MKRVLKSLFAVMMAVIISFGVAGSTNLFAMRVHAEQTSINLVGKNFTVTDIRDGRSASFTPGDGNVYVLIFGKITKCSNTQGYVSNISGMKPYLDEKLKVFELEVGSTATDNAIKSSAETYDRGNNVVVSKYNTAYSSVFSACFAPTVGYGNSYYTPFVVYVNGAGTAYAYSTGGVSATSILQNIVNGGIADTYTGRTISPDVEYHTQDEIRAFVQNHPITFYNATYDIAPSASAPYAAGKPSDATRQDALNAVNVIRYIAGLSYNITLDDSYNTMTQAGSLVNAANNSLSHSPNQPAGMDDNLYNTGKTGDGRSNIACGYSSIARSVIYGYMYDGDTGNRQTLGHRRWVLNPSMGKTGFGIAPTSSGYSYSAMYAFDTSGRSNASMSMWPAFNTPVEYFDGSFPWSLSIGTAVDINTIHVEIKNSATGQTWNFSKDAVDGFFSINNSGYGLTGCIICIPNNMIIASGDSYAVTITGAAGATISYTVNFFSLEGSSTNNNEENNNNNNNNNQNDDNNNNNNTNNNNENNNNNNQNNETNNNNQNNNNENNNNQNNNNENNNNNNNNDTPAGFEIFNVAEGCAMQARMYNPNSGEHFYTGSQQETRDLLNAGWTLEGPGFITPTVGVPIYRLYSSEHSDHFYTTSETERDALIAEGWTYEGVAFPSAASGKPMYRLNNPNAYPNGESGAHHFTTSWQEVQNLQAAGWRYEGIAWYSL